MHFFPTCCWFSPIKCLFQKVNIDYRERCNYKHTGLYFETLLSLPLSGTIFLK